MSAQDEKRSAPLAQDPPPPSQEPSSKDRRGPIDTTALKAAASFLGIVSTGGGGFATLSFAIGYLATKEHDEMVGLPTTITSYTKYVRTGALFFYDSLHCILTTPALYFLIVLVVVV